MYPFPPLGACMRDGLASQFQIGGENETGLPEIINFVRRISSFNMMDCSVSNTLYSAPCIDNRKVRLL